MSAWMGPTGPELDGRGEDTEERFDVVDEQGRPTGESKPRSAVHRDGDWHRAVHVWIVDADDRVLLQRRSPAKDLAGGKIDVTVGGHLRAGEAWPNALREVEEEIGVAVDVMDVDQLGTVASERTYERAVDRELQEVFAMRRDAPLDGYRLDPDEVDTLYAVPLTRAVELWRDGRHVPAEGWDAQARPSHALLHTGDLIEEARDGTLRELLLLAAWADVDVPPSPSGRDERGTNAREDGTSHDDAGQDHASQDDTREGGP